MHRDNALRTDGWTQYISRGVWNLIYTFGIRNAQLCRHVFCMHLILHLRRIQKSSGYNSRKSSASHSYKCMLGLFVFACVLHRTVTWTTGSLTCVSDRSYACVFIHTGGGGEGGGGRTPTASQHLFLCSFDRRYTCSPEVETNCNVLCSSPGHHPHSFCRTATTPPPPPRLLATLSIMTHRARWT